MHALGPSPVRTHAMALGKVTRKTLNEVVQDVHSTPELRTVH